MMTKKKYKPYKGKRFFRRVVQYEATERDKALLHIMNNETDFMSKFRATTARLANHHNEQKEI